eukprot:TRINITY_DN3850_c0_g1_i1.p1 TRINITY_DN3850_c0_g1~~TRINITY_DN3850_c0_g1_i1.p1  ORF type:complete len:294 (+),score=80.24 TRINITY_DN3850_c0_g1_i1:88-969(+)
MALPVGCRFQVVQKTMYKHEGALYELPIGLKGSVTNVDAAGDCRVQWDPAEGMSMPTSKWLLQSSFLKVKVLDPKPITPDVTIEVTKADPAEKFGLAVDMPGASCLLVKDIMVEGLIPKHNAANAENPEQQIQIGDIIVDVNGVYGNPTQMLDQVRESASKVTLSLLKGRASKAATAVAAAPTVAVKAPLQEAAASAAVADSCPPAACCLAAADAPTAPVALNPAAEAPTEAAAAAAAPAPTEAPTPPDESIMIPVPAKDSLLTQVQPTDVTTVEPEQTEIRGDGPNNCSCGC